MYKSLLKFKSIGGVVDRVAVTITHAVEGRITVTLYPGKPKVSIYVAKYRKSFRLSLKAPPHFTDVLIAAKFYVEAIATEIARVRAKLKSA